MPAVVGGATVHDQVTVAGGPDAVGGLPAPTGTVKVDWFTNGTCTGTPAATSPALTLAGGTVDAAGFAQGPLTLGVYAFRAHYLGDAGNASFMPSDGPCEPLRVVAANILIAANGVDRVGRTQTLSAHVVVNDGSGFANAPAGTQIDFEIESGPGSISAPNCVTVGATGACQVGLQSAVGGATTVSAHTTLAVGGISLQRETDNLGGNAPPVVEQWVDARIAVGPSGIGIVGTPRTLTVTLEKDVFTGAFAPAAGEHVDVALTGSSGAAAVVNAAASTCDDAGPNNGRCGSVRARLHLAHRGGRDRARRRNLVRVGLTGLHGDERGRGADIRRDAARGNRARKRRGRGERAGRHGRPVHRDGSRQRRPVPGSELHPGVGLGVPAGRDDGEMQRGGRRRQPSCRADVRRHGDRHDGPRDRQPAGGHHDAGGPGRLSEPVAVDAVEGPRPVGCEPLSGSVFPTGTTTVLLHVERFG